MITTYGDITEPHVGTYYKTTLMSALHIYYVPGTSMAYLLPNKHGIELSLKANKIDIILVSETHLCHTSVLN